MCLSRCSELGQDGDEALESDVRVWGSRCRKLDEGNNKAAAGREPNLELSSAGGLWDSKQPRLCAPLALAKTNLFFFTAPVGVATAHGGWLSSRRMRAEEASLPLVVGWLAPPCRKQPSGLELAAPSWFARIESRGSAYCAALLEALAV